MMYYINPSGERVSCVQLLSLEEKLIPLVLSALEEDAQTSRKFACRSLSIVLELTGPSLHPDALNKIYPRSCHTPIPLPTLVFVAPLPSRPSKCHFPALVSPQTC